MINNYKKIAIIPARGGSKRIPRKNIKDFLGKPIIAYSIEAAIETGIFDEIMVSTDDKDIAKVAEALGANVPFLRSASTSNDYSILSDVIIEVLSNYKKIGREFKYICCLFATAPFVKPEEIIEGLSIIKRNNYDSVLTVCEFSYPPQRGLKIKNDKVKMANSNNLKKRSQDLNTIYHDAGQFYWLNSSNFRSNKDLITNNTGYIIKSNLNVQDIDTIEDWKIAELKYKIMQ